MFFFSVFVASYSCSSLNPNSFAIMLLGIVCIFVLYSVVFALYILLDAAIWSSVFISSSCNFKKFSFALRVG